MKDKILLVKSILEKAKHYSWSLQGFGMLRLYLSDEVRLHVWDSAYRVPDCTLIHDHPWSFKSLVIAGILNNHLFHQKEVPGPGLFEYDEVTIKCGEGAFCKTEPKCTFLMPVAATVYRSGDDYYQEDDEIHMTLPEDGSVSLVTRYMAAGKSREDARVYCIPGKGFVSAAPRAATEAEVIDITRRALEKWF